MLKSNPAANFHIEEDCSLEDFAEITSSVLNEQSVPLSHDIRKNIPVYDIAQLGPSLSDGEARKELMSEWAKVLMSGPGVLVLKSACTDFQAIDDATDAYLRIIEDEKAGSGGAGDHFAAAGANDRIWNSLQKLCEQAPDTFLRYFASPAVDTVCEAWLGPNYQMTAQVNLVHPGGKAQQAHRDYHLGFQSAEISAHYPAHVHDLSPTLTLQGGIAHGAIPLESGPTKLLPFSQRYRPGYAAWRRDDFRAYFEDHHVQLPLEKGDAIFFNPALFHAAGENRSEDIHRMVNLLQVSSAFGRAMESIDRVKMCKLLYPAAKAASDSAILSGEALRAAVSAAAEGYSFPTNLDLDPPTGGLAPETQKALFLRALDEKVTEAEFDRQLDAQALRQRA